MKNLKFIIPLCLVFLLSLSFCNVPSFATTGESENYEIYYVYDANGNKIFESNFVEVGDKIITKQFDQFEIISVDKSSQTAKAEYMGSYKKPNIKKISSPFSLKNTPQKKKSIGLYITHNDESYVPSDGVSSVYGKGGIHDVAKALKSSFEKLNYSVILDETSHIPHDKKAYSRSEKTAKKLLQKNPDAIFDIHRDGVSRSVYVRKIDGKERCKVRIIVGQSNPNKEENLQFAMYLFSVAEEYCPWLFLDIYYAKGHYNQALSNKALLFEMGTYLAEKEIVISSTNELANVVDKTLFSTTVEDKDNIVIDKTPPPQDQDNLVNNVLNSSQSVKSFSSKFTRNAIIFAIIFVFLMIIICINALVLIKKKQNTKQKLKDKNKN